MAITAQGTVVNSLGTSNVSELYQPILESLQAYFRAATVTDSILFASNRRDISGQEGNQVKVPLANAHKKAKRTAEGADIFSGSQADLQSSRPTSTTVEVGFYTTGGQVYETAIEDAGVVPTVNKVAQDMANGAAEEQDERILHTMVSGNESVLISSVFGTANSTIAIPTGSAGAVPTGTDRYNSFAAGWNAVRRFDGLAAGTGTNGALQLSDVVGSGKVATANGNRLDMAIVFDPASGAFVNKRSLQLKEQPSINLDSYNYTGTYRNGYKPVYNNFYRYQLFSSDSDADGRTLQMKRLVQSVRHLRQARAPGVNGLFMCVMSHKGEVDLVNSFAGFKDNEITVTNAGIQNQAFMSAVVAQAGGLVFVVSALSPQDLVANSV